MMRDDLDIPSTPYGASSGEAWRETRTIHMRCRCGREIAFGGQWPMCTECQQVCDECVCPQMLAGVDSGAAKDPTGTNCHCVACGGTAGIHLTTAPACPDCARILPALRRWLEARDATTGMVPADLPVDQVIAMCDEANAANDALVALAREVTK